LTRCTGGDVRSACAKPLDSIDAARIAAIQTAIRRDRNAATVLAAVKDEALVRRPGGRPRPTLRAKAVQVLAGTEEWAAL
jgi:hypothetical protein